MQFDRRTILKLPLLAAAAPEALEQGLAQALGPAADVPGLLRFAALGDSGSGKPAQLRVAEQMNALHRRRKQDPWSFALMMGDNIYENGEPKYFDDKFIDVYRQLMDDGVNFRATLGNHDIRHNDGRDQVLEPAFGYEGRQDEYAFSAGPTLENGKQLARFLCLNSTRWVRAIEAGDTGEVAKLRDRLREQLRESDKYQWNIAYFHHPLYSHVKTFAGIIPRGHGPNERLREILEPEIDETVDVVLAGHEHFYQKIRPQRGVHHIISGAAGKTRQGVDKKHPNVEFASQDYHFMDLSLSAQTLYYQAVNDSGLKIHSGTIAKRNPT
jgi:hypothetical protein